MSKKMTQATRLICYMTASMYEVMGLLEWDMMTYCMFKYECGLMYLEAYLRGDKDSIDLMQRSAAYWGWWKLHWHSRERECMDTLNTHPDCGRMGVDQFRAVFKIVNNPADLAKLITPNSIVLEDSYCKDLVPAIRNELPVYQRDI